MRIKVDSVAVLKENVEEALEHNAPKALVEAFTGELAKAKTLSAAQAIVSRAPSKYNRVIVEDTGSGMSAGDLQDAFLVIGTSSRRTDVEAAIKTGADDAPYLGEKGIGRLSAMRLGDTLAVISATKDDTHYNLLQIDWNDFAKPEAMLSEIDIEPEQGDEKDDEIYHGTKLVIGKLQASWSFEKVYELCQYDFARLIDPRMPQKKRPKVTVFFNGERVSIPRMPKSILDAAHARIEGRLEYQDGEPILTCTAEIRDLGFEHPVYTETYVLGLKEMESTFGEELGETFDEALHGLGPFKFDMNWYNRRRLSRADSTGTTMSLRDQQNRWSGIMLFRNGFRVFPYGEDRDDWLDLDRKALRRSGYLLNKTQFIGRVSISRTRNSKLIDQTNREGLRENNEQQIFLEMLRWVIQDALGDAIATTEREYKIDKTEIVGAADRLKELESRVKNAVSGLKRVVPIDEMDSVDEVQHTLRELLAFAALLRSRIDEAEKEGRRLLDMAGVGLMVEVVAHELARSSENALSVLKGLDDEGMPDDVQAQLSTLQSALKSLGKRIRILDPMSVSGRQTRETFDLKALVSEIEEAHFTQFSRHKITVVHNGDKGAVRVHAVRGMIIQVLENLISNSVHWLDVRAKRDASLEPEIRISVVSHPPAIVFEDNGQGISLENAEKVFHPFFSLKDKRRRRGLGLFIAREIAKYHKGDLTLSDHIDEGTGRLHRFILELPEEAAR